MDIDFNGITVSRMIMHKITEKQDNQDSATVELDRNLLDINDEVVALIKERLIDAAGKQSRAFSLEFDDGYVGVGSLYQLCDGLSAVPDDEFIDKSCGIVELLASCQRRANIPGGYFILIDCQDEDKALYVIIKAEPHQALQKIEGVSGLSLLKSVFLSPSQKLYKIGMIIERENPIGDAPNEKYDCFLFDDQFRTITTPAEYFYKEFLGFSIGNNAKIQSQRFYDKTHNFIVENIEDTETKTNLLEALRNEFLVNQNPVTTPSDFARVSFPTPALRDEYIGDIAHELPASFVRDTVLIKNRLNKRKINFQDNINLSGPNANFDENVQFVHDVEEFQRLIQDEGEFTIVKIKGRPYSDD